MTLNNTNLVITKFTVDPTTHKLTSLYINNQKVELADDVDIVDEYDDTLSLGSLNVGDTVTIPVEGYDGAKSVVLTITE